MKKMTRLAAVAWLAAATSWAQTPVTQQTVATPWQPTESHLPAAVQHLNEPTGLTDPALGSATAIATLAQPRQKTHAGSRKADADYPVITAQPAGELKTYTRSGSYLYNDNGTLRIGRQKGFSQMVFGDNNKVYIKNPLQSITFDSWVEGTLSDDGKTITVPVPQYLAYEGGVAAVFGVYNSPHSNANRAADKTATAVTFSVSNGTITLNDLTSYNKVITAYRSDNDNLLAYGDYATVFTLFDEPAVVTPPAGLVTEDYPLTATEISGSNDAEVNATVTVGWQGNDVYIKGMLRRLPEAWVKGTLSGTTVSFPVQYVGRNDDTPFFISGYSSSPTAATAEYDSDEKTFSFGGTVCFNSSATTIDLTVYYNGMFIGVPPTPITPPAGLETKTYPVSGTIYDADASTGSWANRAYNGAVEISFDNNDVYIKGLLKNLADSWVKGTRDARGNITLTNRQYVGKESDYGTNIYLLGYDSDKEVFTDVVLKYYADEDVYIAQQDIVANGKKYDWYFSHYFLAGLAIGNDTEPEVVTLPTGITAQAYPFTGTQNNGQDALSNTLRIAFDGNDVYVQGLAAPYLSSAWVKGTKDGAGNITLPTRQKFGTYTHNGTDYDLYFVGYDIAQDRYCDVVLNLNPAAGVYTLGTPVFVSIDKRELVYVAWYDANDLIGTQRPYTSFDFNSYDADTTPVSSGSGATYDNSGDILADIDIEDNATGIQLTVAPSGASTPNRFWKDAQQGIQLRLYGGTLVFQAPAGQVLRQLVFDNARWNDGNTADTGTLDNGTWTGNAEHLVITIAGNTQLNKIAATTALTPISIAPKSGTDLAQALSEAKAANPDPTAVIIDLAANGHYTISASLNITTPFTLSSDADAPATIDASALTEPFIRLGMSPMKEVNSAGFYEIADIIIKDVVITGLNQQLIYANQMKHLVEQVVVDNSIIAISGGSKTIFDFNGGGVVGHLSINNSTIYAQPNHEGQLYSSQSGQKATEAGLQQQVFSITHSTLANIAYNKNVATHRQSNQSWLAYEVKKSIIADCGKDGQFVKGLNGGTGGANPTWDIDGNSFLRTIDGTITDNSSKEETGDANEPVKNNVTGTTTFGDPENGDFTVYAGSHQAKEQVGDPRWLVPYDATLDAISTITTKSADGHGACYTLQGIRTTQPVKGIYIQNGKKVVVK